MASSTQLASTSHPSEPNHAGDFITWSRLSLPWEKSNGVLNEPPHDESTGAAQIWVSEHQIAPRAGILTAFPSDNKDVFAENIKESPDVPGEFRANATCF